MGRVMEEVQGWRAAEAGGKDNITVVIVQVGGRLVRVFVSWGLFAAVYV